MFWIYSLILFVFNIPNRCRLYYFAIGENLILYVAEFHLLKKADIPLPPTALVIIVTQYCIRNKNVSF